MRSATLNDAAVLGNRNRVDRLGGVLADERRAERRERLADELRTALRACLLSTCQKDRSAVQTVADAFKLDASTVYGWIENKAVCRAAQDFFDLVDACIAAKGADNPAALELVRLAYRRYLVPLQAVEPLSLDALGVAADALREPAEAATVLVSLLERAPLCDGPTRRRMAKDALREIEEAQHALAVAYRLAQALEAGADQPTRGAVAAAGGGSR